MFRNRNSQKPNDELYASFKASFPHLNRASTGPSSTQAPAGHSLTDALDVAQPARSFGDASEDLKDADPTPRGNTEQWRFTPSLLDPNSFAFASFANQPPGYYTPTPGGTNTIYHNQAGDLHTPGFSFGLGTPLSLPTSEAGLHAGQVVAGSGLQGFNPQHMNPSHFQGQNPFNMQPQHTFPPHHFTHQQNAFDQMQQSHDQTGMHGLPVDVVMQERSPVLTFSGQPFDHLHAQQHQQQQQSQHQLSPQHQSQHQPQQQHESALESFRYHVTLNAPTAMIKHADEIPVTYLNKGQAYTINIVDSQPHHNPTGPVKYRTYIRISFEDEAQRQRPSSCWQLWKEGRGTNEAHQRGGRLQAVEFVNPNQVGGGDATGRPEIEVDYASFDGFSIFWSPLPNGANECSIAVRFNFLSTDFSHSKGVKGIPVRLCAKTELILDGPEAVPGEVADNRHTSLTQEICYCKVKLFRDHGAERKLSNDVAHVKKTIDKLKQQITQAESGMKEFGKRKRSGSISKGSSSQRPGKVAKHKRTWSMSSQSSTGNTRQTAEEDLHLKLASLQDMFTSTKPSSPLYLRGEESDDPDLHPVRLPGESQQQQQPDLAKIDTTVSGDPTMWDGQSAHTGATSSIVSPTPSSLSLHSGGRRGSSFPHPTQFNPPSRMSSGEWRNMPQTATGDIQSGGQLTMSPPNLPVKIAKQQGDGQGTLSSWIEALGVDYNYQPPPERTIKPVASLYILPRVAGKSPGDNYYRAVYLMQRTVKDLVNAIATKSNVDAIEVIRTVRVNPQGLTILFDDESVRELPEGQDMTAEFHEIRVPPVKREWDSGPTDIQVDGDVGAIENVSTSGYELRLLF